MYDCIAGRPLRPLDDDISKAIPKLKERDQILAELSQIDCGACGAPSCRDFAEDVAHGEAEKECCVFLKHKELVARIEQLADFAGIRKTDV